MTAAEVAAAATEALERSQLPALSPEALARIANTLRPALAGTANQAKGAAERPAGVRSG